MPAMLLVLLVAALALATPAPGTQMKRRQMDQAPNVVLVASDSFDGRLTFQPGSQVVKLPFINFMRAHGTTFLNAYTNSPICCPSRAAMWSGLFTHLTESWNNFKGLDPNYTTWMDVMEKHGYQTQKFGKLDYTSGHHSIRSTLKKSEQRKRRYKINRVEAWTREVAFLLRQEGRPIVNLIPDKNRRRVMVKDWQNTDKTIDWLRQVNYTKPFVLYLGLNLPHPYPSPSSGENFGSSTFQTSLYWLEKVAYDAIKIPKWLPLSQMHSVDYYSSYTKNCTGKFTENEIKNIRAFYYAMCAETDAMLDHGEMAMEHRQFYKMSMYEASVHVPFLMMGPGVKANLQVSSVVSLVDIYPTMLDIAGIALPPNLSGYSLLTVLSNASANEQAFKLHHPPWILSEFHGCNANASTYMLRTGQWKYIAYSDGASVPPQLFDLSMDPDELTNIATEFPEIIYSLDQKLRSIINYPKVSASVHRYNKEQFIMWKQSVGQNYSNVIAHLRWHQDWQKDPRKYENAIQHWLTAHSSPVASSPPQSTSGSQPSLLQSTSG
ncbi:arylsulfatase K isoform X3 [Mastomys coucha]|uniref:arylsulfatase K isoform X3 n=1 Tax=Mastomys coucha TaxID=35658 RepID=UPI0012622850|nr:arylsulfatase K isoform X3 [Mastomys coucha]